jgi:iron(III) transport system substrate-binding protein
MMKRILGLVLIISGFFAAAQYSVAQEQVVNLYSSRHYETDEALFQGFTDATGISVNIIEASGDVLIERLRNEGINSPADIYLSVDVGRLWRAEEAGFFEGIHSRYLEQRIPENLRHPEGKWFGFSTRARVIVYNRDLVDPNSLSDYEDLSNEEFKGLVCIRSSSNIYNLSLLASLIEHHGVEAAEAWARGVVENFARSPQGGDTDQIRAVASGECGIGVANSYYYARLMRSDDPDDQAVVAATGVIFPNQNGRGTHVNISGAGLIKTAPNRDNAILFLEYLASDEAQSYFADGNNEYPVVAGLLDNEALLALGAFDADTVNVSVFGIHQAEAQRAFDRAGWN